MDLGVCIATKIDDIDHAVLAEQLGYSHLWVADSQMLWSDCYATMALIAARTERIKLGTGVAVAGTRTSAVTAAAHATINRLAPGRVFCGIGTGNTAMRVMGARPMPIAEFERYIEELRGLLDGDETEVAFRGWHPQGPPPDAGPWLRRVPAPHPALRLRVRPAGDGARRAPRRRAGDVGATHARRAGAGLAPGRRGGRRGRRHRRPRHVPHRHADDDGRARGGRGRRQPPGPRAVRRVRHRRAALRRRAVAGGGPARPPPAVRLLGRLRRPARRGRSRRRCTSASTRGTTAGSCPRRSASSPRS